MPGPKPTPTATLKQRGSWRGDARDGEPEAIPTDFEAPSGISDAARAIWDEMAPMLVQMRVLSKSDVSALVRYCDMRVRYAELHKDLMENGTTEQTEKGTIGRPEFNQWIKCVEALAKLDGQFGLTPAARVSVRAAPKPGANDGEVRKPRLVG